MGGIQVDGDLLLAKARRRPLVAEIATAAGAAVIVATIVIGVGVGRGTGTSPTDPLRSAALSTQSGTPTTTASSAVSEPSTESPESTPTESTSEKTTAAAKVTKVNLAVDPADYTGPCPVTVTISASIFTDTGPVTAHYRWLRAGEPGLEETVRFGGPGPQRVTVTDSLEAVDDLTASESLRVLAPNDLEADPVDIVVRCTPIAQTWLEVESICATPYTITYHGSITVPHGPMSVKYVWERSDGAIAPTQTLDFPAGGEQTLNVDTDWTVGLPGEFRQRIKILEPYEGTSNWSTFTMEC